MGDLAAQHHSFMQSRLCACITCEKTVLAYETAVKARQVELASVEEEGCAVWSPRARALGKMICRGDRSPTLPSGRESERA